MWLLDARALAVAVDVHPACAHEAGMGMAAVSWRSRGKGGSSRGERRGEGGERGEGLPSDCSSQFEGVWSHGLASSLKRDALTSCAKLGDRSCRGLPIRGSGGGEGDAERSRSVGGGRRR